MTFLSHVVNKMKANLVDVLNLQTPTFRAERENLYDSGEPRRMLSPPLAKGCAVVQALVHRVTQVLEERALLVLLKPLESLRSTPLEDLNIRSASKEARAQRA